MHKNQRKLASSSLSEKIGQSHRYRRIDNNRHSENPNGNDHGTYSQGTPKIDRSRVIVMRNMFTIIPDNRIQVKLLRWKLSYRPDVCIRRLKGVRDAISIALCFPQNSILSK